MGGCAPHLPPTGVPPRKPPAYGTGVHKAYGIKVYVRAYGTKIEMENGK
jgi:hypothetical protein